MASSSPASVTSNVSSCSGSTSAAAVEKDISAGTYHCSRLHCMEIGRVQKDSLTATQKQSQPRSLDFQRALHIAAGTGKAARFVEKLVKLMPIEDLSVKNLAGETALHVAAITGNTQVANILVNINPDLPNIRNNNGFFPISLAAIYFHRDTVLYLLTVTKSDVEPHPFTNESGPQLLVDLITAGFFDVALRLLGHHPELATFGCGVLRELALRPFDFRSGSDFNFLQSLIYSWIPLHFNNNMNNHCNKNQAFRSTCSYFQSYVLSVKFIDNIRHKKLKHYQALELVKRLCDIIKTTNEAELYESLYNPPLLEAAESGIPEIVEEILEHYPEAIWYHDKDDHYIFDVAVINRCENIFNLVHQMSEHKQRLLHAVNPSRETILHLVARLAPQSKLHLVSGAALQMQRELQWFKEVEKLSLPKYRRWRNNDDETPYMVFTREHRDLVIEGEKWMKDTANSCTIAAALIATVVFAAAITVPGGNNGNGFPVFSRQRGFVVFAVSDAISLFSSTTSLLVFLSILTSRYAEQDFLYVLPKRLIMGLLALFLSITSMMIAFSTTLYLVFGQRRGWILLPVAASACLPVTSFVTLQFPLLVDLIYSTYGRGIFGKKGNRMLY